jgi:Nuclease-related domain
MAVMYPAEFPHDLDAKPRLAGEKLVYDALRSGLGAMWSVFYDRPVQGTPRRVDFVAIDPVRGAVAIEVKGGLVHASRGAFRQLITPSGLRKRINPFGQLKMAFARVCDVAGVDVLALPVHFVIWFPQMAQSAFTWEPSPHIWTREAIEAGEVGARIERLLPARASAPASAALWRLVAAVKGGGAGL